MAQIPTADRTLCIARFTAAGIRFTRCLRLLFFEMIVNYVALSLVQIIQSRNHAGR